jgi:hypothetical protein
MGANHRAYLLARVDFEQVQQPQALEQPLEHRLGAHGVHLGELRIRQVRGLGGQVAVRFEP